MHGREEVAVGVERQGDAAMAKPISHDLWVNLLAQQEGGGGVAEIVHRDLQNYAHARIL